MSTLEALSKKILLFGGALLVVVTLIGIFVQAMVYSDMLSAAQQQEDQEVQVMAKALGIPKQTARRILRNDPDPFDILKSMSAAGGK